MMYAYKSPGVYVEEVPSGNAPIVGAGTSTAAFIGSFDFAAPPGTPSATAAKVTTAAGMTGASTWHYQLIAVDGYGQTSTVADVVAANGAATLDPNNSVTLTWTDSAGTAKVLIYRTATGTAPATTGLIATVKAGVQTFTDSGLAGDGTSPTAQQGIVWPPTQASVNAVVSCNNFTDFANALGDLKYQPSDSGHTNLAHAVYGFFLNGGSHCYVVRIKNNYVQSDFDAALAQLEPVDDISILAAPGMMNSGVVASLIAHCEVTAKDRIAVFDSLQGATPDQMRASDPNYAKVYTGTSTHAALYYPWIRVQNPNGPGTLDIPPSGHVAGIYARVDATRGVHKAPANEPVLGAVDLVQTLSRRQQDLLNPDGINCIRRLNGSILVWGARTLGGDKNLDVKYVPVRRLLNFLRVSIDQGTQWTVFEPNGPDLWARVIRNVSAFLKSVWTAGALFGSVPEQAFYVKCDAENNPQASRDNGYLIVEIGVAIVRPAEFVVFTISQWSGPQK